MRQAEWRFIESPPGEAAFNMALDEALLRSVAERDSPPVLRVYSWSGPSVSLGYNQEIGREIDLERCRHLGVAVVRRPTGGRSVYHDRELTYSLCGPGASARLGRSLEETTRMVAEALCAALDRLGISADEPARGHGAIRGAAGLCNPCFSSASRYEISVAGRKLIGSAQRRSAGDRAFLQQGSVLIANSQARLAELAPGGRTAEETERIGRLLAGRVTCLEEAAGRPIEFAEAARAFREGFAGFFGGDPVSSAPTAEELRLAGKLVRERYGSREWLLKDNSSEAEELVTDTEPSGIRE